MDAFLDLLKFIFFGLIVIVVAIIMACWLAASMKTLHYTKQNNVLLRELCVENGINVDSALNTLQNDTLNLKIDVKEEGMKKSKSFLCGVLSGIVEPISALITILATSLVLPILPYILSFAAGTMIYVVIEELIPESQVGKHSNMVPIGFSLGFVLMMILDIALS